MQQIDMPEDLLDTYGLEDPPVSVAKCVAWCHRYPQYAQHLCDYTQLWIEDEAQTEDDAQTEAVPADEHMDAFIRGLVELTCRQLQPSEEAWAAATKALRRHSRRARAKRSRHG